MEVAFQYTVEDFYKKQKRQNQGQNVFFFVLTTLLPLFQLDIFPLEASESFGIVYDKQDQMDTFLEYLQAMMVYFSLRQKHSDYTVVKIMRIGRQIKINAKYSNDILVMNKLSLSLWCVYYM